MNNSSLLTPNIGLPESTRVKRSLPKAQLFKRFDWKPSQRESFDCEVSRLDFLNLIAALERQMNATKQPRRKRELFLELQKLKDI